MGASLGPALAFVLLGTAAGAVSVDEGREGNQVVNKQVRPDAGVRFVTTDAKLQSLFDRAEKVEKENIRIGTRGRKMLVEGDEWVLLWLETQPMGGVMYGKRDLDVARNNIEVFLELQADNGLFPSTAIPGPTGVTGEAPWYGSLGMLSIAQACLDFYYLSGKDKAFLERAYHALEAYDGFLWKYRDSDGDGCLEVWGIGDTGEDQTTRFKRAPHTQPDPPNTMIPPNNPDWDVPVQSMDIMSDSFDARNTLAEMARLLGNGQESVWRAKALEVLSKVISYLWRPTLHACYDRDKTHAFIDCLCHNNMRCMYHGTFTQKMADEFVEYHLMNPREFWTYMPLPAIAINDPYCTNDENQGYCAWSGPSQGLAYQRAIRALENYGHYAEVTLLGRKLIANLSELERFPVCFVPTTGAPRGDHGNYGPTILSALEYMSRLYGVQIARDHVFWSGISDGSHGYMYTQFWLGNEFKLENSHGTMAGYINGKSVFRCTADVRVVTDVNGKVLQVVGIDSCKRRVALETGDHTYPIASIGPNQVFEPAGDALTRASSAPFEAPKEVYTVDARIGRGLVAFTGTWEAGVERDAHGGTLARSNQSGDSAEFGFVGTNIKWIGKRGASGGFADVYVDGRLAAGKVDLYSPRPKRSEEVLFAKSGLGRGPHTIKVVVCGAKNPKSADTLVGIDTFEYGEPKTQRAVGPT